MNNSIAIITARGGSKRIPKKNIKPFLGKPIIAYSIEAAINSGLFDEVMVSTDSDEIAAVAKSYGASIPFYRSKKNSDDMSTSSDVIAEVIEEYNRKKKEQYDYLCCIYPTAPFVTSEKLKNAMNILWNNEAVDAVIPVVKFSFPPQRGLKFDGDKINIINPDIYQMRSQDLEPIYHECGQYYCMKTASFMETRRLVLNRTYPIFTAETEVQDIDTMDDWALAEIKYQKMIEAKEG